MGQPSQQPNKAGIYPLYGVDGPAKPDIAGNVARSVRPAVLFAHGPPWCSKSVCCAVLDVLDLAAAWCPASSSCSSFMWRSVRGHCRHLKTLMGFHVVDRHCCFFQNSHGSLTLFFPPRWRQRRRRQLVRNHHGRHHIPHFS